MEEKKQTFTYTYSAKEKKEIEEIRSKYAPQTKEETSMERLRRLDKSATRGAAVLSLIIGILSSLVMGVGMCCAMLPGWDEYFALGIVVGALGIIGVISAYPLYNFMARRKRRLLAPEIMRLSDELMK